MPSASPTSINSPSAPSNPILRRTVISLLIGLIMFAITLDAAWRVTRQLVVSRIIGSMDFACSHLADTIADSKHSGSKMPITIASLKSHDWYGEIDSHGNPIDGWMHPVVFSNTPKGIAVTSFGEDGKPGGTGADSDVTVLINNYEHLSQFDAWYAMTFAQFLHSPYVSDMLLASCATGGSSALLAFFMLWPRRLQAKPADLVAQIVATLIFTGFVGLIMVFFDAPVFPEGH